jgi:hypothetical protein
VCNWPVLGTVAGFKCLEKLYPLIIFRITIGIDGDDKLDKEEVSTTQRTSLTVTKVAFLIITNN